VKRREFIVLLGGTAAWPLAARAQQAAMPMIGYLSASMTGEEGFQQGLKETGLIEGRHFAIEYRSSDGQIDRLPAIVADVVARRVTAILAVSDSFALAAKAGNGDTNVYMAAMTPYASVWFPASTVPVGM
jgi:hypothetical protein